MIDGLEAYPAYKESELSWLDKLPEQWKELRSKYLFREVDNRSVSGQELRLSMSQVHGLIPSSQLEEKRLVSESNVGGKICEPNDLVLNRLKAHRGVVALAPQRGLVSPDYTVLRAIRPLSHRYFCSIYRSPYCGEELRRRAKCIVEGFWRLYTDDFYDIRVPAPSLEEQAAIVRFLDHANAKIDRAIRAKKKLIALLNEQKQAIIHRAVTRGLDPGVKLKGSGVPWLGDVPEHWEVLRSKYIFREIDNRSATGNETHLSMSQKLGLVPRSLLEQRGLISESYVGAKLCKKGDLVLNRLKAHLGVFALAPEPGLISPDYTVLRPARDLESRYFEAAYRTPACRVELRQRAKGIVQGFWRLYTDDFYDIKMPVPSSKEQREIMNRLTAELATLNTAIARTEREIDLLREYRTRLTADVVTGKLDVREAVKHLPVESEEPLPADDLTEDLDDTIEEEP